MTVVLDKAGRPMRLVAAANTTPIADGKAKSLLVCNCPNLVIAIAEYMVSEMKNNPGSAAGKKILELNSYDVAKATKAWMDQPWYTKFGGPPDHASIILSMKIQAYKLWKDMVGYRRPWDHKPILARRLAEMGAPNTTWHRYGHEDYFYDIWSNIHYGYVGVACGFSLDELLGGASVAQAMNDSNNAWSKKRSVHVQYHPENGDFLNRFDDVPDQISIRTGAELFAAAKPSALTLSILLKAVVNVPLPWGTEASFAKRPHECAK